jgi:tetratricopeptide (TPR) repeat protein
VKAHLYQQALDDLTAAVSQAPEEPLYYIEKAALQLRVNLIDDCIATCQQCLKVTDRYPDLFRILGYAYAQKGNREEALRMLNRAIQLGDASAQELIDKYVK